MSTPVSNSLNAWRRVSKTERVSVKERGRICAHEGCDTLLSIYNPGKHCSAHTSPARGRRRGASQEMRNVTCEHCGDGFQTRNTHRKYCSDRCRMAAFARRKRAAERALRRLVQQAADPAGPRIERLVDDAA